MRDIRKASWTSLAVVLVPWAAACTGGGMRAQTGMCPTGETCSDQTPNGLYFLGSALGEEVLGRMEPLPIAVGGSQKIKLVTGSTSTSPAFSLPFMAVAGGAAIGITATAPPEITVLGKASGTAFLRIVEPGTNLLYDRLEVSVKAIDHFDLKPRNYLNPGADEGYAKAPGKWVLLQGGSEACVARLFAADGERLVDEGMTMSVVGPPLSAGTRDGWDALGLTATGTGVGLVAVSTSDTMSRQGMVTIVDKVDDIASIPAEGAVASNTEIVQAGVARPFCFRATNGGNLVAGVTFTFTASAGVTTSAAAGKNCVGLTAAVPTTALVTVKAAGVTRDFPVTFVAR